MAGAAQVPDRTREARVVAELRQMKRMKGEEVVEGKGCASAEKGMLETVRTMAVAVAEEKGK